MRFENAYLPGWAGWSSPFARWQGPLAGVDPITLATEVATAGLAWRGMEPSGLTHMFFGWTVPGREAFYGGPTIANRIGAGHIGAPMISQACATGVATLHAAAAEVEHGGGDDVVLALTSDRTSNGPQLTFPAPDRPGGAPRVENWVLDNFDRDPITSESMVVTAERVADERGISKEQLDDVVLLRDEQYRTALADDRAFQREYMVPVHVPGRKPVDLAEDHGVFPTSEDKVRALRPVIPGGVVTYATQTYPADGAGALVVSGEGSARDLSPGEGVVQVLATATARVDPGYMPLAPIPAARRALSDAGVDVGDLDAVSTHNPFAVNDIALCDDLGIPVDLPNQRGCSLIYGHPQAPTGTRGIVELVHHLREKGGGVGLFTGCAAGDTGAAAVLRVQD